MTLHRGGDIGAGLCRMSRTLPEEKQSEQSIPDRKGTESKGTRHEGANRVCSLNLFATRNPHHLILLELAGKRIRTVKEKVKILIYDFPLSHI